MHQEIDPPTNGGDQPPSPIGRLPICKYCLLEQLLPLDLLKKPLDRKRIHEILMDNQHATAFRAHRLRVEDACSGCNLNCTLKILAMCHFDDRLLAQMKCIEVFKLDRSKKLQHPISWEEAGQAWHAELTEEGSTYSVRFSQLWERVKNRFHGVFVYEIVMSPVSVYQEILRILQLLDVEAGIRDKQGK